MLIAGATVFTVNANDEIISPCWVRIRDGVIETVSAQPIAPDPNEELIDATGRLLLPGFVNTHTHLFQTLFRGVYEERPLAVYLDYIYRSGTMLEPEDCRHSAMLGCLEQIRSGATTVVDHHFLNRDSSLAEGTIEGMLAVGVRGVVARTVMDIGDGLPPQILERPEAGLRSVEALLKRYHKEHQSGMMTIMTGPNTAGVNASEKAVLATQEFARAHSIRRSSHIAEYRGAVEAVRRRYGYFGVVEWLSRIGALGPDLVAVHAVHVRPEEIAKMAEAGTSVSHNPFSNLFCGDRNAPVSDYLRAGIPVGFGTDGAANNNAMGVLDALRITRSLQRTHLNDPEAISPEKAIRMATIEGARAIGLDGLVGSIEPRKCADLIVIDYGEMPHTVPTHNLLVQLVHSVKQSDVRTVIVNGRVIMRDRTILTVDEKSVLEAATIAARNLVKRLG